MDRELKENKRTLRAFMREHYTDERLAMLLAHAQSGRLSYTSCCCFIGIPTANHSLQGDDWTEVTGGNVDTEHIAESRQIPGARYAERAFLMLGGADSFGERERFCKEANEQRRRRLIPIVKAEMKRRAGMFKSSQLDEEVEGVPV